MRNFPSISQEQYVKLLNRLQLAVQTTHLAALSEMLPGTRGEQQFTRLNNTRQHYAYTSTDDLWIIFADGGDDTDYYDE
jgi:hypothetical protein